MTWEKREQFVVSVLVCHNLPENTGHLGLPQAQFNETIILSLVDLELKPAPAEVAANGSTAVG